MSIMLEPLSQALSRKAMHQWCFNGSLKSRLGKV
jgi:hypothetical protein